MGNYKKQMNQNDCCCFCFTARTGVMIIGTLMWIGFFFYIIDMSYVAFVYYSTPDAIGVVPWQYGIAGVCNLILAIKFCRVVRGEHREGDWERRKNFAKSFFIINVIIAGILSVIAMVVIFLTFQGQCVDQGNDPEACHFALSVATYSWSISLAISICWQLYLAHV